MTYPNLQRKVIHAKLHPTWDAVGMKRVNLQKYFCKELNERSRPVQKTHVHQPQPLMWVGKGQFIIYILC